MANKKRKSHCSARVIPYFFDKNNNIILIMVKIIQYGDWTALGGHCDKLKYRCENYGEKEIMECMIKEMIEESRFTILEEDIDLENSLSMNYNDDRGVQNNLRFVELIKNPDMIRSTFHNEKLVDYLKTLPKSKSKGYMESDDIKFLVLDGDFLNFAINAQKNIGTKKKKIDDSLLNGLYSIFETYDLTELVSKISRAIRSNNVTIKSTSSIAQLPQKRILPI